MSIIKTGIEISLESYNQKGEVIDRLDTSREGMVGEEISVEKIEDGSCEREI